MQSSLAVFVPPHRQRPAACDLKQGTVLKKKVEQYLSICKLISLASLAALTAWTNRVLATSQHKGVGVGPA